MMHDVADALAKAQDVAIIAHMSPDGDTLGSCLALYFAMKAQGKRCCVVCQDEPAGSIQFLPYQEALLTKEMLPFAPLWAVSVDIADEGRMGSSAQVFTLAAHTVLIDHHATTQSYATYNWIDPSAAATAQMVYALLQFLGWDITKQIALCLYTGLSTDTGNFSFENTTRPVLEMAAQLVGDVDVSYVTRMLYRQRSESRTKLLAKALASLMLLEDGRIAILRLTKEDIAQSGAQDNETEGIVNYAIEVQGAQVALFARETQSGIKISMRSLPPVDVSTIAAHFGGGGHPRASGITMQGGLQEVIQMVADAMKEAL